MRRLCPTFGRRSDALRGTQVARELLLKELPLHLRLLGIRMTNLKDLEAPEKGIKKVRLGRGARGSC